MPRAKSTPKSEQTRNHILTTAKLLFRKKGFENTTLRDIADHAEVAVGLTYRYFPHKQQLALALYLELAEGLDAATRRHARATLADGFAAVMRTKLRLVAPHRGALAALFAASLTNPEAISVIGPSAAPVRERVRAVLARAVERATDLPPLAAAEQRALVTVLNGIHLLILLAWLLDTRGSAAAYVDASKQALARAVPLLALPPARGALCQVASWLDDFLEETS
jgi:AcrR family transcriptional regulator